MFKCEAISDDCSTVPNYSDGIIVNYSTYYSLFTTQRIPFQGAVLRRCYAHSVKMSAFDHKTAAESSAVVSQPSS
ncbi:hypothetical protein TNCV_4821011 [Trichonephila clavipes]|nr:hypothetical protein TNCV_4821011 [Trichonephila clavipes]